MRQSTSDEIRLRMRWQAHRRVHRMTPSRHVHCDDLGVKREIHANATDAEGRMMEEGKNQHPRSQGEVGGSTVWQCDDAGTQRPTKAMSSVCTGDDRPHDFASGR